MHPVIIFFMGGPVLSSDEIAEVEAIGVPVRYRNARFVGDYDIPEVCDGVAGQVPTAYASFPTATEAVEAFASSRLEEYETFSNTSEQHKLDDVAPPVVKADQTAKPVVKEAKTAKPKKVPAEWTDSKPAAVADEKPAAVWAPGKA